MREGTRDPGLVKIPGGKPQGRDMPPQALPRRGDADHRGGEPAGKAASLKGTRYSERGKEGLDVS